MRMPGYPFLSIFSLVAAALGTTLNHKRAANGTWQVLSAIPFAPRQEHATVAINATTLAILGGIIPDVGSIVNGSTPSNSTGFVTTNLMQLYDIPSDTWTSASPLPVEVNHANAAVVDGKIYLLGGLVFTPTGQSDRGSWVAIPDCLVYDPMTDGWLVLEAMPEGLARGAAVAGVYGSRIYLAGGLKLLDLLPVTGVQDTVANVTAFDTTSGTWVKNLPEAAQQLPEARDHAVGAVVGSTFYVIGGRDKGQTNVKDTVFALDMDDLNAGWRTSAGRMPTARGGLLSGTVGASVYTFGGEGNSAVTSGVFNETEVFDTSTEVWTSLAPMRLPRHGTSAAAVGDRVYVPGGGVIQGATPVNVTDVYVAGGISQHRP